VGEVIGSVSMLAVTIGLLAGASAIAVLSIHDASSLVQNANQSAQRDAGVLISVLTTQSNSSGTFVWLYDYGWASEPVKMVYVAGQPVAWTSNCGNSWSRSMCVVTIPAHVKGEVTVMVGGISIAATI
jgi:hypothetical protein